MCPSGTVGPDTHSSPLGPALTRVGVRRVCGKWTQETRDSCRRKGHLATGDQDVRGRPTVPQVTGTGHRACGVCTDSGVDAEPLPFLGEGGVRSVPGRGRLCDQLPGEAPGAGSPMSLRGARPHVASWCVSCVMPSGGDPGERAPAFLQPLSHPLVRCNKSQLSGWQAAGSTL